MKYRVYIAGKLNDDAVGYIKNLHKMIKEGDYVRRLGYSVYIPGLDFLVGLQSGDMEYPDYFNNSQPWLEVSDAILLVKGWETSNGTKREIELAEKLGIPVFEDLLQMHLFFQNKSK